VAIPNDQQILHILPQEFIIDGQEDARTARHERRPAGKVHIVTGANPRWRTSRSARGAAGLVVKDVIRSRAPGIAVLNDDEKELASAHRHRGGTTDWPGVSGGDPADCRYPDRRRSGTTYRDDAAHADEGRPRSRSPDGCRCASSPIPTTSSRSPASVTGRRASFRGRRSPK
jgi:hypothetical protein